jgi:histidine triad (HIT) family protein
MSTGYGPPRDISVFEAMLSGTEPCNPVFEDDDCACIVDGNPQSPLHFLVFPKDKNNLIRLSTANSLHEKLLGHMLLVAKDLAVRYGYEEEGFRIVINDGPAAFQRIPHLAIHVLAGRQLSWPPG